MAPVVAALGVATWWTHQTLPPGTGVGQPSAVIAATMAAPGFRTGFVVAAMAVAFAWAVVSVTLGRQWRMRASKVGHACTPLMWGLGLPAAASALDAAAFWCTAPPLAALGLGLGGLTSARGLVRLRRSVEAARTRSAAVGRRPRLAVAMLAAVVPLLLLPGWPRPSGDEPHYLLVAESIWYDGDLDLADDYERRVYRPYHPEPLSPHHKPGKNAGTRYSMHGVGFPLLLLPAFLVGRSLGDAAMVWLPRAFLAMLYGVFVWTLYGLVAAITDHRSAVRGTSATALLAPLLFAPLYLFPEVPAMLLACAAYSGLRMARGARGVFAASLVLALLPWLGVKYIPLAVAIAAAGLLHAAPAGRWPRALITGGALLVSLAAHSLFTWALYGSLSPMAVYLGSSSAGGRPPAFGGRWVAYVAAWSGALATAIGYLIDQKEGLLAYGPHFLLAAAGLPWLWRLRRTDLIALGAIGLAYLGPYALSQQLSGQGPPVRPLMAVIWLLASPLGLALSQPAKPGRWFPSARGALLALSGCLCLVFALVPALLPHDYPVKASRLLQAYTPQAAGWWRLFPQWVNVADPDWGVALAWALVATAAFVALTIAGRRRLDPAAAPTSEGIAGLSGPARSARAGGRLEQRPGWLSAATALTLLCGGVLAHHTGVAVTGGHRSRVLSSGITAWTEAELPARAWPEPAGVWVRPGRPVALLLTRRQPIEALAVELRVLAEGEVGVSVQGSTLAGTAAPGRVLVGRLQPGRGWRAGGGYVYHCLLWASRGVSPADLGASADERQLGVFLRFTQVWPIGQDQPGEE